MAIERHFKGLQLQRRCIKDASCPVRSDRQTTSLTLTTGVCVRPVRKGGDASIMNIHYDVTGLLTVVWRSHSGQIVWPAGAGLGRGGSELIAHIRDIKESAGSRQLDRLG